jgi:hypothetical protein
MNNRTLIIIGLGLTGAFTLGYLLGRARITGEAAATTQRKDGLLKRAVLATCAGFGEGAGKALGEAVVGGPAHALAA